MLRTLAFTLAIAAILCPVFGGPLLPDGSKTVTDFGACWQRRYDDPTILDVASNGDFVYISRAGGRIQALSAAAGDVVWSADLGGVPMAPPLPTGNGVAVLTGRSAEGKDGYGDLRMLSKQTGVTLWSTEINVAPNSALYGNGNRLVVIAGTGIKGYEAANGRTAWSAISKDPITGSSLLDDARIVAGTSGGTLRVMSILDGRILHEKSLGSVPTTLAGFPDGPIVVGDEGGRIFAFELDDRDINWDLRNGGRVSSFAKAGDRVIATSFDNFVYALTSSGNIRWKRRLSGRLTGRPAVGETVIMVAAANEGTAYAIETKGGKVLDRVKLYDEGDDSRMSVARIAGDRFVIAGSDIVKTYGIGVCSVNAKKQP